MKQISRYLILAVVGVALVGCTTANLDTARDYQSRLAGACKIAMAIDTGWAAPWIKGACASEAAIATLALDATSLDWLRALVFKVAAKA